MSRISDNNSPQINVKSRVVKYIMFDSIMSGLPILADCIICFAFNINIGNIYRYCIQLCVMTIVLSATSIKCISESEVLKKYTNSFYCLLISNIAITAISLLVYGILEYITLSSNGDMIEYGRIFILFAGLYIISFVLGLLVQIGGGIG